MYLENIGGEAKRDSSKDPCPALEWTTGGLA
jgi:hypothetical protein